MRIALITEGVSEFKSLPKLSEQFYQRSGNQIVATLLMNVSPDASMGVMARECAIKLKLAISQRADLAIILLDRETQQATAGEIASNIESAICATFGTGIRAKVVIKDRCFENWLIADLEALRQQPGRFKISKATEKKVAPNKADSCDATSLIKVATNYTYSKTDDSFRICSRMDVGRAALNSRSFRHFLHVIEDRRYSSQCLTPSP